MVLGGVIGLSGVELGCLGVTIRVVRDNRHELRVVVLLVVVEVVRERGDKGWGVLCMLKWVGVGVGVRVVVVMVLQWGVVVLLLVPVRPLVRWWCWW
jgi:hypothetical protein